MKKKISPLFTILKIGLFGTVSGSIFFSPLPSLIALLLAPIYFSIKSKKISKITLYALLFYFVSLLSLALYDPAAFLNFDLYRRDGNFIISFAPLLVFPFLEKKFNIEKLFYFYLVFCVVVNVVLFFVFFGNAGGFRGLYDAHNASGGFLSILSTLAFAFFWRKKSYINLILFVLSFFMLFATDSRGSLLGFLLGVLFYFLWKNRKSLYIKIMVFGVVAIQIVILIQSYPVYKEHNLMVPKNIHDYIYLHLNKTGTGQEANIYLRSHNNWPRGVELFLNSPIVGTGFGSINDVPFDLKGIPGIFTYNAQPLKVYDAGHAHHSYLNILGEQGLLGFSVFILLLSSIFKFISKHAESNVLQAFLVMSFFNLMMMSFTEHRFVSPSNALPFIIPLCLYIIYVNGVKKSLVV